MTAPTFRSCLAHRGAAAVLLACTFSPVDAAGPADAPHAAQADYPNRPIRLLVGLPPGGSADTLARIVAPHLGENLGQRIVVDNRVGASGVRAAVIASNATPDGYILLLRSSFLAELVASVKRQLQYDIETAFDPVSLIWKVPNVLVVNPALGTSTMADLVKLAKGKPGQLNYASAGIGTSTHLAMELVKSRAGIDLVHVPYPGAPQAIAALLNGAAIQVMFGNVTAQLPHIRSGKLRALAVTSAKALPALPDVPPIGTTHAALEGLEISVWVGLAAPAGVPKPILAKLNSALVKALERPEVTSRLAALSAEPAPSSMAQFADFQKAEIRRWMPIVKNLRLE